MKLALFFGVAAMLVTCGSQPFAPTDTDLEPLSVVVTPGSRTANVGEAIPSLDVTSSTNTISVYVTTRAVCGTAIVNAGVIRKTGEINVVSRVWSGPLADCAGIPATSVSDYMFLVPVTPGSQYRVNMFEARGQGDPDSVGSKSVSVIGLILDSR